MAGPAWLEPLFPDLAPPFVHGMTNVRGPYLKSDPDAAVHAAAVAEVGAAAGLVAIAWSRQVHGGTVKRVEAPGCAGEADALWTDRTGLAVMGRSADCPIVLLAGRNAADAPLWGMAHASWRSTASDITGHLLEAMIDGGLDPATTVAVVAPSAGPCCYEVGDEVREAFVAGLGAGAARFFSEARGKWILDLWAANSDALRRRGLAPDRVHCDGRCTICGDEFPSYRRDGAKSGRFGVFVGA